MKTSNGSVITSVPFLILVVFSLISICGAQNIEIRSPIGNITIEICQVLKKVIPKTAYFDKAVGTNELDLKLLNQLKEEILPATNIIQLNSKDRTIYIVPEAKASGIPLLKHYLRAINTKTGDYIDDLFFVNINGNVPAPSILVTFKGNVLIPLQSKTETLYKFIEKIYLRTGRDINNGIDVFVNDSFLTQQSNQFQLTYQNCSIRETTCDMGAIREVRMTFGLFEEEDSRTVKEEFKRFVLPDFNVTDMSHQLVGSCKGVSDKGPFINPAYFNPLVLYLFNVIPVKTFPGMLNQSKFPKDFYKSEMVTDVIRIELMEYVGSTSFGAALESNQKIPKHHWAYIWGDVNDLNYPYKLDVVWIDQSYTELSDIISGSVTIPANRFTYRGIDQYNRKNAGELKFQPGIRPEAFYTITFEFSSFNLARSESTDYEIMVLHMKNFMNILISAFGMYNGSSYSTLIYLKSFTFISVVSPFASGNAVWAVNVGPNCDYALIKYTQNIMYSSIKDKIINPLFKQNLNDLFILNSISETYKTPCSIEPPQKSNPPPVIDISYCGLLEYLIPENTFIDKQDGNTRNLVLTMTDSSNNPLSSSSWLQFDQGSQTVHGLLPSNLQPTTRQFVFILSATDSTGLTSSCDVVINIKDNPLTPSYRVAIRGQYLSGSKVIPSILVAKRVGDFFKDNSQGFQLLSSAILTTGDPYIEFTNCTWRQTPCDAVHVNTYMTTMFNNDQTVKNVFKQIFEPEFTNPTITGKREGACEFNKQPTNPNPWGPLTISTCETFQQRIPENTFNDAEQGNTRALRLTCTGLNSVFDPVVLPPWAVFGGSSQELTVIATDQLQSMNRFELKAFDVEGLSVSQNLILNVLKSTEAPSHRITMEITSISSQTNSYVTLYKALRERILFFFGDTVPTISYIQSSSYPSTRYNVIWTNCTVSRTACETNKINYIRDRLLNSDGTIKPSLVSSLRTFFTFQSLKFEETGICVTEKQPPIVKNLIPDQELGYCEYLTYKIPENTFEDVIDGTTRSLTLSMTLEDGSPIPYANWLGFNIEKQEITVVLQSFFPLDKNEHTFILKATNRRFLSVTTPIIIRVIGEPQPERVGLKVNARATFEATSTAEIYAKFLEKTAKIFTINRGNFHLYSGGYSVGAKFLSALVINCKCENITFQDYINSLNNFDTEMYKPEFQPTQIEGQDGEQCGVPPVPEIITPPRPFKIGRCQHFEHELSNEGFKDTLGVENLILTLTSMNGQKTPNWITTEGLKIIGIVTHETIQNTSPEGYYNATLRVTNALGYYTETWVEINVMGELPQTYYQYELTVNDNNQLSTLFDRGLSRQMQTSKKINNYFGFSVFDITSYEEITATQFKIKWSVCNLENRCTSEGISRTEKEIFDAGDIVKERFKNAFQTEFTFVSIKEHIQESCKTIDPPVPREDPLKITFNYCGGLEYVIPENTFVDAQDGNARNLKLYLRMLNGGNIEATYPWMHFNEDTQTITAMPTYDQALGFLTNFQQLSLTAMDLSGQESTIKVWLMISLQAAPKYWYIFIVSSFNEQSISDRFLFMDRIADFQGDKDRRSIGFKQILSNRLDVYNCSVSVNPCDLYLFEQTKRKYSSANDIPTTELIRQMKPTFDVVSVSRQYEPPCGGPNTPKLKVNPPEVGISICAFTNFIIPEETFYDCEEGNTRNLKLSLTVKSGSKFSMTDYVNFDSKTQTMTIVPKAELFASFGTNYVFSLTATDNSGLSASTDLTVKVTGPYDLLRECQIQVTVQIISTIARSTVQAMNVIIQKLATFFGVTINEIGIVDFYVKNTNQIYFAWSYCSASYKLESYRSNSNSLKVDHVGLQQQILMKLFLYDRKTVNPNFNIIFESEYKVIEIKTAFTNRCRNLPPIVTIPSQSITINIGYGGYYVHTYRDNYFYDFEDGWAYSLSISFTDATGTQVNLDSWTNVDVTTYNIYAVVNDYIRFHSSNAFLFYLKGTDSIGQYARITVNIIKTNEVLTFSPFNITYLLQYNAQLGLVYANQSSYIINRITSFWSSITTTNHVLVRWYYKTSGYSEYRIITWSLHGHTCSSDVLAYIKNVYKNSLGELDTNLVSSLQSMFALKRVYYHTTCDVPPTIYPPPEKIIPTLEITFCSIFSYKIPIDTFINGNGLNTYSMQLQLLTQNGDAVSRSSWIQINYATLEIYAVAIQSVLKTQTQYEYQLSATNSGGATTYVKFSAVIIDQPFTADCKMIMSFTYKHYTSTIVYLDIIRTFIDQLSSFYKDSTVKIKILSFIVKANNVFEISWSNCSFVYQSQQLALSGLTENDRGAISTIFSQIVLSNGNIVTSFRQHMSTYFEIQTLVVNYDCIEEPPAPQVTTQIVYAKFCQLFNDSIPRTTFIDKRDGDTRNLKLTLADVNGKPVPIDHWIQLDDRQNLYGIVTEEIKQQAGIDGFKYLLIATDTAGLSANVSYIVRITSPLQLFDVYFRTGFQNRFDYLENTSKIMYDFVNKVSKYLDPLDSSGNIYVKRFQYPSVIEWVPCSMNPCTVSKVTNALNKLVSENGIIRSDFVNILSPSTIPTTTRLNIANANKCSSSNITIIIVNPPPNPIIPNCGYFTYKIRSDQFRDTLQRQSNLFYLNLYYENGGLLPKSSWIRFNETEQYIYGITILSKSTEASSYRLEARHQSSGMRSSVATTVTVSNYGSLAKVSSKICYVTFNMTVRYNQGFDDVTILRLFMETLGLYFKRDSNEIQIESYARGQGYPFVLVVTWTNCTLTSVFIQNNYNQEYYQLFTSVLNRMMITQNSVYTIFTQEIQRFFTSTSLFTITSIKINDNCSEPPKKPPLRQKDVVFSIGCGVFEYKIPDDTFTCENGGISQLSLKVKNLDGSELSQDTWIVLNRTNYLIGLLRNATYFSAVGGQHKFILEATDSQGLTGETSIIVNMPENPLPDTPYKIFIQYSTRNTYSYQILHEYELAKRFNRIMYQISLSDFNLFVPTFSSFFGELFVYLSPCTLCDDRITYYIEVIKFFNTLIVDFMQPDFDITTLEPQYSNEACKNLSQQEFFKNLTIPYCSLSQFNITAVEGEEVSIYFDILAKDKDGVALPLDSWLFLNHYVLEAYPPKSFWTNQRNTNWTFQYTLKRKSDGLEPYVKTIVLKLEKDPEIPTAAITFTIRVSTTTPRDTKQYKGYYISLVMNALIKLTASGKGIHFVSYTELQQNPFVFEVKWENCSLRSSCDKNIDMINSILLSRNLVGNFELSKYFPAGYKIDEIENRCTNTPIKKQQYLNLTVPVCGTFRYKLEENIVTDQSGATLKDFGVNLLEADGSPLPIDSWIRYNGSSNEIYALPNEAVASLKTPYVFKLRFTDRNTAFTDVGVNVTIVNNERTYYELSITFNSLKPSSTPYLDLQIKILELISMYKGKTNLDIYRILTFQKTQTQYYLRFGNCSVGEELCRNEFNELEKVEIKLFTTNNKLQSNFQTYIKDFFNGIEMKRESTAFIIDQSPVVTGEKQTITIDQCQAVCVEYINAFYDESQGKESLVYTLKTQTDVPLLKSYWTQLDNDNVCVYPWLNVTKGTYNFKIVAKDKCGSEVSNPLTVVIRSVYEKDFGYKWTIKSDLMRDVKETDVHYLRMIRERMSTYLKTKLGNAYTDNIALQITDYEYVDNKISVSFGDCSIQYRPCNQSAVSLLATTIFDGNNQPSPELIQLFGDVVTDIKTVETTGNRQYPCSSTPQGPNCNVNKLTYNTSICASVDIKLPNICTDAEDGMMDNLFVKLYTQTFTEIPTSSWIQFNESSKHIYGYPMYQQMNENVLGEYRFILEIKDKQGNPAIVDVCINLLGPLPSLDYQVTIEGRLTRPLTSPFVNYQICMINQLKPYFNEGNLTNINFVQTQQTRSDAGRVEYTFGFCEMRKTPCDCMMVKKINNLINNAASFSRSLTPCLEMVFVSYELYGECKVTSPPRLENGISEVAVTVGQVYKTVLPYNQFVDDEDGSNANLTIIISNEKGNTINIQDVDWMTVYNNQICGIMDYYDFVNNGYSEETKYKYYLTAIDSCGKERADEYNVRIVNTYPGLKYKIMIWFTMSFGDLIGNCTELEQLIQKLADYSNVPTENVVIEQLSASNDTVNGTYFAWGVRQFSGKNCKNEDFELFREKFFVDEKGKIEFIRYMNTYSYVITKIMDMVDPECKKVEFPWWAIFLIIILLLLFLIPWLLWICIPRCCATFCLGCCTRFWRRLPCCNCCGAFCKSCCMKGGKCASLRDKDDEEILITDPNALTGNGGEKVDIVDGPSVSPPGGGLFPVVVPEREYPLPGPIKPSSPPGSDIICPAPIPLSPNPNPDPSRGSVIPFKTESWVDDRLPNIRRTHFEDNDKNEYYNKDTKYIYHDDFHTGYETHNKKYRLQHHDDHRHEKHTKVKHLVPLENRQKKREIHYVYEPQHHRRYRSKDGYIIQDDDYYYVSGSSIGYDEDKTDGYYVNKSTLRRRVDQENDPMNQLVRVKQPVAVRVKRSELNEYLQGRENIKGNQIHLKSKDLAKLLKSNAKISILNSHDSRSYRHAGDSRLTDALIDRRFISKDNHSRGRRRSYSTSSANDFVAVNQDGKKVAITPQSVRFRMKGYENTDYVTSSNENYNDNIILTRSSNLRHRTVVDSPSASSSTDERKIWLARPQHESRRYIIQPETSSSSNYERKILVKPAETRRRLFIQPDTSRTTNDSSDLIVVPKTTKRRKVYEVKGHDSDNKIIEMKNSNYSKTFINKGYRYDDSEC